ncbi:MAG: hypothetical protein LBV08_11365 [Clostridiales bacterium]|nr:hypothetical protein [Clostridiales bacterium]
MGSYIAATGVFDLDEDKKLDDYSPYRQVNINDNIQLRPPKKKQEIIVNTKGRPFYDNVLESLFIFFMTTKKIFFLFILISYISLIACVILLPAKWKVPSVLGFISVYVLLIIILKFKKSAAVKKSKTKAAEATPVIDESEEQERQELNKYFPGLTFNKNSVIEKDEILKSYIVSNGNFVEGSYHIKGEYNNMRFENSNVKIYEDNKKSKFKRKKNSSALDSIQYFFDGQWLIFDTNMGTENSYYIWTNNFKYPNIDNCLSSAFIKISTKDEVFNQNFIFYAKSKEGLANAIPPQAIKNLENFVLAQRKKFPDLEFAVSYADKKLRLAFNIESSDARAQTKLIMEIADIFLPPAKI